MRCPPCTGTTCLLAELLSGASALVERPMSGVSQAGIKQDGIIPTRARCCCMQHACGQRETTAQPPQPELALAWRTFKNLSVSCSLALRF